MGWRLYADGVLSLSWLVVLGGRADEAVCPPPWGRKVGKQAQRWQSEWHGWVELAVSCFGCRAVVNVGRGSFYIFTCNILEPYFGRSLESEAQV